MRHCNAPCKKSNIKPVKIAKRQIIQDVKSCEAKLNEYNKVKKELNEKKKKEKKEKKLNKNNNINKYKKKF